MQDFVPMEADIRVMLIGHKPVCAFWRRPTDGGWLTNTSQGGSMDYKDVPKSVLDLAVKVSKAANAEYWACDVAYGMDKKPRILECATAFAAFPYIRDWIGQYLMWSLSEGRFRKPHIPMFNWEELSKMDSSILRTMRHITFGKYSQSFDGEYFGKKRKLFGENQVYLHVLDKEYPMLDVIPRSKEEWPSEKWNYQDNLALSKKTNKPKKPESVPSPSGEDMEIAETKPEVSKKELKKVLKSVDGIGDKKIEKIFETFGKKDDVVGVLEQNTDMFKRIKGISKKTVSKLKEAWEIFKNK